MKTAHKINLARAAYLVTHRLRALAGLSDRCVARRNGARYDLDLSQGIDFALYVNFFERHTKKALQRLVSRSTVVLDIGANIGAHTLLLAQLVGPQGRVLSFEPTQFAFLKQKRNLELNPDLADRVQPFQCLLSSQDGAPLPQALYSSWPLTKPQNVHAKHMGEEMPTAAASARRLDSILEEIGNPRVRLVKLDVDGNECDVLEGAINLLKTHRPVFVMELAPYVLDERGASLEKLLSLFHPHGYKFYDERTERPLPSTALEMSRLIRDGESINIIARTN